MNLRICSWNTWHGLNAYQRVLMMPMEGLWARRQRRIKQIQALQAMHTSAWDIFCLQEICPIQGRRALLEKELKMRSAGCAANVGIKVAGLGLPLFLSEGLVTLSGSAFKKRKSTGLTLSGNAKEMNFAGLSMSFQLHERRRALVVEADAGASRIAIVNLHLHHGPSTVAENAQRKFQELKRLEKWLKPRMKDWDFLAICGDFNNDPNARELKPLMDLDLKEIGKEVGVKTPTWSPGENSWAKLSSDFAGKMSDEVTQRWDGEDHRFDRIYFRTSRTVKKLKLDRVFDATLSDHFGVLAEVSLK